MTTVGTCEAKTQLTQLLGRVARGEKILITNRGKPVAMLVPPESETQGDVTGLVEEMLRIRDERGPTLGRNLTVRQMMEEGRQF